MIPQLEWGSQGHNFVTDWRVLESGAYDGMLRIDWLGFYSPMQCDWKKKEISFVHQGQQVLLQGIHSSTQTTPEQATLHMMQEWEEHNEIWAMATIEPLPPKGQGPQENTPTEIKVLLADYTDVFAEPQGLPPSIQHIMP